MKGRTNASGGKGISTTLKVRVNGENSDNVGGTVTVKKGGTTVATGTTTTGGVCSFDLGLESGSFDVAYAKGSDTASGSVDLTLGATAILNLNINYVNRYWGIIIDESNTSTSGAITYPQTLTVNGASVPNAAYGKTPAKSAANGFDMGGWANDGLINGIKPVKSDGASSPTFTDAPTNASQWTTGTEYFTEFPFMWLSITKSSSKITVIMSSADTRPDSTFQCWAFAKANDGVSDTEIQNAASTVSRDSLMNGGSNATYSRCFRLGCFLMSGNTSGFYSKANTSAFYGNMELNRYWVGANARGSQYDGMSFAQWVHIQALFLILYKDRNSQAAHSSGLTSASSVDSSNAPLSTTAYGMAGSTSSARNAFFWIHDIWGNYYQFIASVFVRASSSTLKIHHTLSRMAYSGNWDSSSWNATSDFAEMSSKGFDTGSVSKGLSNYYNSACGSNGAGFLVAESATSTSETTGWPDRGFADYYTSYATFPLVGGRYDLGAIAGLFYAFVFRGSTYSNSACCARLSFRG